MPDSSSVDLFCIPFAGAGASFYHQWSKKTELSRAVKPLQLPGRERQIALEPFKNLNSAADALTKTLLDTTTRQTIALFGHCFLGSVLAYEIALRLDQQSDIKVKHLFISAARTPDVAKNYGAKGMSDDEFIAMVENVTGYRHPAFAIPEMRELLLPALRADFEMDESYPGNSTPLSIPITAIAAQDDALVTPEQVEKWRTFTRAAFTLKQVNGSHMYLADTPLPLLNIIEETLNAES